MNDAVDAASGFMASVVSCFLLQVFAVRSGGATGVVVKGPDDKSSVAFRYVSI